MLHAKKEQFSYGYPDPSLALDQMECLEDSSRSSDHPDPSPATDRVIHDSSRWGLDYPDPSLGLLPAEEEEEEEEQMEAAYA